jgi:hypothetical protein
MRSRAAWPINLKPLIPLSAAALTAIVAVSCQPRPDPSSDRSPPAQTPPTVPTADHHPPPRSSQN